MHVPSQSISSASLIQFSKPCCPSLLPLSPSRSSFITISSGFQQAIPSYLFTLSKHKLSHLDVLCGLVPLCAAACFAPHCLQGYFAVSQAFCIQRVTSAAPLSGNGHDGGSLVGSCQQTSTKHFHRPIIWPDGGALSVK